jgi:Flp pilus assembly protein TadD
MKSTIAMAILVAMVVSLAACDIQRGSERATQGKSGDEEGGSQESGRSQTKREQPKKPETLKGEVAKKPSQEQQQKKPEPEPTPSNIPGLTPQDV